MKLLTIANAMMTILIAMLFMNTINILFEAINFKGIEQKLNSIERRDTTKSYNIVKVLSKRSINSVYNEYTIKGDEDIIENTYKLVTTNNYTIGSYITTTNKDSIF